MKGLARGNTPVSPTDIGEPTPTRSARSRTVSNADISQAENSIDTTSTPMRVLPVFRIRRFLAWPFQDGSECDSSLTENNQQDVPERSEPGSTSGDEDYRTVCSVPSLSSLEAGGDDWESSPWNDHATTLVETGVPLTFEEKARYFANAIHSQFDHQTSRNNNHHHNDPKSRKSESDFLEGETDSECGSNNSSDQSVGLYAPTLDSLDRQTILFPSVSLTRGESCTSYMFSVFVGVVVLMALVLFMVIVGLR